MNSTVTPEIKEAMLLLLEEIPSITKVRKVFGIKRSALQRAREADPDFNQAILDAKEEGYDAMEEEAYRRAVDGVPKPVFYRGEECGSVQEFSDTLLQFMLKHCRPKKFNPGVKVVTGDGEKVSFTFNIGE